MMKLKNIMHFSFFNQVQGRELEPKIWCQIIILIFSNFKKDKAKDIIIVVIHYHLCVKISIIHLYMY